MPDIKYYQDKLKTYTDAYELLSVLEKVEPLHVTMAERSFYDCMALAAACCSEVFEEFTYMAMHLVNLADKFMFLTGLNEDPDEMPYVLQCIRWNAAYNLSYSTKWYVRFLHNFYKGVGFMQAALRLNTGKSCIP